MSTVIFYNYLGQSGSNIVNRIATSWNSKMVIVELGGVDQDVVQNFGRNYRRYTLRGLVKTYDESLFMETLVNNTGSINYTAKGVLLGAGTDPHFDPDHFQYPDFLTTGSDPGPLIDNVQVFYSNLIWTDVGDSPSERIYNLEALEIG